MLFILNMHTHLSRHHNGYQNAVALYKFIIYVMIVTSFHDRINPLAARGHFLNVILCTHQHINIMRSCKASSHFFKSLKKHIHHKVH